MDLNQQVGEALWQRSLDALKLAREQSHEEYVFGRYASSHFAMLSAYNTVLPKATWFWRKVYLVPMFWRMLCVLRRWDELDHNQLDVILAILIKLRMAGVRCSVFDRQLLYMSQREVKLAETTESAMPHQLALAYLTLAEVLSLVRFDRSKIESWVEKAVELHVKIRDEESQPHGLRQLVRIHFKASKLYELMKMNGYVNVYSSAAYNLAVTDANTPDQAEKIRKYYYPKFG